MKRTLSIFISFVFLFLASCTTEFNVNDEWEETTVVYGLLDAGTELQQVKISKAFLGNMDALQMAQYSDSVNYNLGELDVVIYKATEYGLLTDSIMLNDSLVYRDSDVFHDSVMIYSFMDNGFLKQDFEYSIKVRNKASGNIVEGSTSIVGNFGFGNMDNQFKFYKPFNPDTTKFTFEKVEWTDASNASIYQLVVRINYVENGESLYLDWVQPLEDNENSTILEGKKFFSFLQASEQLQVNSVNTVRIFQNIDLYLTAGTSDLHTYMQVNEPVTGIVQQRPVFSNINNGIGLFTSRYSLVKKGEIQLSDDTKDYIKDNLSLNFQ